ncbi:MAG: putative glycoside hydrolase [Huintestinicola sp.]
MSRYRKKKIFRPKRHYKIKRRSDNAIKIVTGVICVGILVFVGYSVAGPVSDYLAERANHIESEPWTPGSEDDPPVSDVSGDSSQISDDSQPTETAPAASESAVTQDAVTQPSSEPVQTVTQETVQTEVTLRNGGAAASVSIEDMADAETLSAALESIKNDGCTAVILPMKAEGGFFYYSTEIPLVSTVTDGEYPVRSRLSAKQISDLCVKYGLRPVALVSVLYDNNRYGDYRDGSYRSQDDSTWLDTSPEKGGKPWLSPFDDVAIDFCCDIVRELGEAGFAEIICDDFIFPEFRSTDIELLGEQVSPYSDRYLALTSLARKMTEAGEESNASVMLRITANSIIKGYSELFEPDELYGCRIMIDYSENNISRTMISGGEEIILDEMEEYDKVTAVFAAVAARSEGLENYPMICRSSMSADEYDDAVRAVTALGYDKYYIY